MNEPFSPCLKITQNVSFLQAVKLEVFEFSCLFCFELPKFTHSTAESYQNSPNCVKKNTDNFLHFKARSALNVENATFWE